MWQGCNVACSAAMMQDPSSGCKGAWYETYSSCNSKCSDLGLTCSVESLIHSTKTYEKARAALEVTGLFSTCAGLSYDPDGHNHGSTCPSGTIGPWMHTCGGCARDCYYSADTSSAGNELEEHISCEGSHHDLKRLCPCGPREILTVSCDPGLTPGPDGGPCTACEAGKYKATTGSGVCIDCDAGKYSIGPDSVTVTCGGSCGDGCTPSSGTTSGTFSDGPSDYSNNENCWWLMTASTGTDMRVSFPAFNTESGYDFVSVFRCSEASCSSPEQVMRQSGSLSSSNVYNSVTGFLKVTFTSDGSVTGGGFTGTWSTGSVASTLGATTCLACPANSNSSAGSQALSACTCNPGFNGPNGGPCMVSSAGSDVIGDCVSSAVYKLGATNQNCEEVCGSLGPEYSCDRVSTSNVNSQQLLIDVLASVGHIVPATASFDTQDCSSSGWGGNVPFLDIGIPSSIFGCPDTSKTMCDAKHIYRQRVCACHCIIPSHGEKNLVSLSLSPSVSLLFHVTFILILKSRH